MKNIFSKDYQIVKGKLQCPSCEKDILVKEVLENSTVSWPYKNWIYYKCTYCSNGFHVEVNTDKITTGELDGAPGPVFFPCSEIILEDFDVITNKDNIECRYEGKNYIFNSKK